MLHLRSANRDQASTTAAHQPLSVRAQLFHLANLQNAGAASSWAGIQIALGILAAAALFSDKKNLLEAGASSVMLVLTIIQQLTIVPEQAYLAATVDAVSTSGADPASSFWRLDALYTSTEVLKLLIGCGVVLSLFIMRKRSRRPRTAVAEEKVAQWAQAE